MIMGDNIPTWEFLDTSRVAELRRRVREAMEHPPVRWECPVRIAERFMWEPQARRPGRSFPRRKRVTPRKYAMTRQAIS